MSNHYEVLGVAPDATTDEIHEGYRRLAKEHHPDAGGADARMAELNDAWRVLGDPATRRAYDRAQGIAARGRVRPDEGHRWQPGPRLMQKLREHGFDDMRTRWAPTGSLALQLRAFQHADFDVLPRLVGPQLWGLHAQDSWIDDQSLAHVAKLGGLRVLDVSNTHVTDLGMPQVAKLRQLEDLAVWGTHITDQAIPWVASMVRLVNLNLGATRITDDAIGAVSLLPRLQILNLRETGITEKGLLQLNRVPALRILAVPHLNPLARHRVADALAGVTLT